MKKILIISSSPNSDGLTAACVTSAKKGIKRAGASAKHISLNKKNIKGCLACENGWGICKSKHSCIIKDDFDDLHQKIANSDAFIFISPVYWSEMSEISKSFFDRLRRCEASKWFGDGSESSVLLDKNAVIVAAAGGSGNGTISCLTQMEMMMNHLSCKLFDRISITRFNKRYKLQAIEEASFEIVNPETLN